MQAVISKLETQALSVNQLKRMLPRNCTFWFYDRLPKTKEALFRGKDSAVIFYQLHNLRGGALDQTGHFSLVMKGKTMRFFSSYGLSAEREIHKTHSSGRLIKLLGKNYMRNRRAYQTVRNSQTCGFHCIVRAHFSQLNETQYSKLMSKFLAKNPDDLATIMCLLSLQKN
jgi:hypothetical protein